LADFVRAVENGTQPLIDGREGRRSVEVISAIYQSAAEGRSIAL
jgi:predicted dehydrogenase